MKQLQPSRPLSVAKEAITETRPLVLDSLLKIPANFMVCTEWTPLPADRARKEVNKRRRHFNMSKTGFVSQLGNDATKTNPRDVLVDESKQADIENLGDCLRALGDGQSLGDFSLSIVLYGDSKAEVDNQVGEFVSVFTNADGNLFTETYNQLNAYFATVPGNYALNLRRLYLLNSNYADLSFLFTILPGETRNAHLGTEYLAVLETDNSTPYFLNLHNGEVAHTLILGMTGSGKSYFCNFILQNAQKYTPQTYIFDIGGSFQSLTTIFGGSYLNVGQDARDFTINPFSLSPTKENLQFLFSFFRVLIEGNEQRYRLDFKEERRLWDAIERIYVLEPEQRTVSSFSNIIGELKERLHRWTQGGQYGFLFDNSQDTLSFSQFQTFNFAGWGDAPEVLEPLLFYVLHRASNEIADPKKLATFKMFLLDEAWLFIKNETIRSYIVSAQKTWRKHNAAMILATQSIKELEESGMLQIVSESCPTKIFLANPEMDRELYREAFHLNDTELELIAGLVPPGQMLIRKAQSSKKVQLNVDSVTHWTATNNARDNLKKREYFERHGIADPKRLHGIAAYREISRDFSEGGRRSYIKANEDSPLFPELRGLIEKTSGIVPMLREAITGTKGLKVGFVYGSLARGEEGAGSDVDVMILGDVSSMDLSPRLRAVEAAVGRQVNSTVFSTDEFDRKAAEKNHFLRTVMRNKKIMLVGTEDELEEIARGSEDSHTPVEQAGTPN
jgi:type IV secretion system protein VirB4